MQIVLTLAAVLVAGMLLVDFATIHLTKISLQRQRAAGAALSVDEPGELNQATVAQELGRLHRLTLLYMGLAIALALLIGYILLTRLIVRPVSKLRAAAMKVAEGQAGVVVEATGSSELVQLQLDFNQMSRKLGEQHSTLEQRLEEIEKTADELRKTQDRLIQSAKLATVGRLAAGVAHEIGNPLSAIKGFLDLLETADPESEDAAEYRRLASEEVERIHRVIGELLAYARPGGHGEAGVILSDAVERSISLLRAQRVFDNVDAGLSIPDDIPPVMATMDQLSQILVNILLNAAQAMDGRGKVSVEADLVGDWKSSPEAEPSSAVRIRISDTGPGISEEDTGVVFEPFYSTKSASRGTGLGLAVTQSICERQGGMITVENSPEGGACFSVVLPVQITENGRVPEGADNSGNA